MLVGMVQGSSMESKRSFKSSVLGGVLLLVGSLAAAGFGLLGMGLFFGGGAGSGGGGVALGSASSGLDVYPLLRYAEA